MPFLCIPLECFVFVGLLLSKITPGLTSAHLLVNLHRYSFRYSFSTHLSILTPLASLIIGNTISLTYLLSPLSLSYLLSSSFYPFPIFYISFPLFI
jgi:hypothetical protein